MTKVYLWELYFIALLTVLLSSCNTDKVPHISKISDYFGEEVIPFQIKYDHKDRPVYLGSTPISYDGKIIKIGEMNNLPGYGHIYDISYEMEGERVVHCEANIEEKIEGKWTKLTKNTSYTYMNGSINITSNYYYPETNDLVKSYTEIREYDKNGKLDKSIIKDSRKGNYIFKYNYDSNIHFEANLNLQAYAYCTNGADDMFAYLLNLYNTPNRSSLPSEMSFQAPNGTMHQLIENYTFEGDRLVRMDIVQDYDILAAKISIEY